MRVSHEPLESIFSGFVKCFTDYVSDSLPPVLYTNSVKDMPKDTSDSNAPFAKDTHLPILYRDDATVLQTPFNRACQLAWCKLGKRDTDALAVSQAALPALPLPLEEGWYLQSPSQPRHLHNEGDVADYLVLHLIDPIVHVLNDILSGSGWTVTSLSQTTATYEKTNAGRGPPTTGPALKRSGSVNSFIGIFKPSKSAGKSQADNHKISSRTDHMLVLCKQELLGRFNLSSSSAWVELKDDVWQSAKQEEQVRGYYVLVVIEEKRPGFVQAKDFTHVQSRDPKHLQPGVKGQYQGCVKAFVPQVRKYAATFKCVRSLLTDAVTGIPMKFDSVPSPDGPNVPIAFGLANRTTLRKTLFALCMDALMDIQMFAPKKGDDANGAQFRQPFKSLWEAPKPTGQSDVGPETSHGERAQRGTQPTAGPSQYPRQDYRQPAQGMPPAHMQGYRATPTSRNTGNPDMDDLTDDFQGMRLRSRARGGTGQQRTGADAGPPKRRP